MHCPQCGQLQLSDEARFCKSCGLSLVAVRTLLATDAVSPILEKEPQKGQSPRRKGVRQGVMLLFVFMVLMPLVNIKGSHDFEFLPMMVMMAGMMRILYAVIFQEGAPKKKKKWSLKNVPGDQFTTNQAGSANYGNALPTSHPIPVTAFNGRRGETAEMIHPPSVTENTTKLLNDSQDSE